MSGDLAIIRKNRTLMTFMSDFMKNKGVVNEWAFIWTKVEKEPTNKIFARFFAKKPKVKTLLHRKTRGGGSARFCGAGGQGPPRWC